MDDRPRRDWRALCRFLPWVALGAYGIVCLFFLVDPQWRPEWDSAIYLLTGKALALGEGYTYLGRPFFLRPPGLAWLLSLLVEDGAYDFRSLNLVMMGCAVLAVVSVFLVIRPLHGTWTALAVALLTGTQPLFVGQFNLVLSEFPFLALLFVALRLLHESARRAPRWWLWGLAGALALAGAIYLRTVGVLVLPAVLCLGARSDQGRRRLRAALPVVVAGLLFLPWMLHAQAAAAEAPRPPEQLLLHTYATAQFHTEPGDPDSARVSSAGWLRRVEENGSAALGDVARTLVHADGMAIRAALALLILVGWVLAVRQSASLLEWFALCSVLLLVTYFTYAERLLMPLTALLYLYLLVPVAAATRRLRARIGARAVALPVLVVTALFAMNALSLARTFAPQAPQGGAAAAIVQERESLRATAEWIAENTPPQAVLLCNRAPQLSLLSGRRAYTYRFLHRPDPIARYAVDYVVLDSPASANMLKYVEQQALERWVLPSPNPGPKVRVFRVR